MYHHYESNPESEVRFEIESNLEASQVPTTEGRVSGKEQWETSLDNTRLDDR